MPDVFDQLLTLLHPDRLLRDPRAESRSRTAFDRLIGAARKTA